MSDEDIALRFSFAAQLNAMNYGHARIIAADLAHRAWPPTGDHDRSIEGAFRALALASGGNRPEASYTTKERIINDLDESFTVEQRREDGAWKVERLISHCPHCRGAGFIRKWPEPRVEVLGPSDYSADASEVVTVQTTKCDHRPAIAE